MKTLLLVAALACGCYGAHRENNGGDDIGPTCGDTTCDEKPADTCVDSDTLRRFEATCTDGTCGYPSMDLECGSSGCCGDHCCAVAVSNMSDFGELRPTGLVVAPPNGEFDTDADCVATSALGTCAPVTRTDLPQACVCRADEITIGSLRVKGSRALVLLAWKKVVVQTLLDVSADFGADGPGASFKYDERQFGFQGGVGGSFATAGGGAVSVASAAAYGEATLQPLLGGMRGQAASMIGGGGGGALQISAGERIEINGLVNAGGGGGEGGRPAYNDAGGGGGGSGGGVLIEGATVVVAGTVVANGGAGGGGGGNGGYGGTGYDGGNCGIPVDPMVVAWAGGGRDGAGCPLYGYVSGGDGGYGSLGTSAATGGNAGDIDSRCLGDTSFVGMGGGGGGTGRIRINTQTGCQCGGKMSPAATFGTLVKQ